MQKKQKIDISEHPQLKEEDIKFILNLFETKTFTYFFDKKLQSIREEFDLKTKSDLYSFIWFADKDYRPTCDCGKILTEIRDVKFGYKQFCSNKCIANNEAIKLKKEQTSEAKYGCKHPMQSSEVQETLKRAVLEKYGVENIFMLESVQEQIRERNIETYGCPYPNSNPEFRKIVDETNEIKYGCKSPLGNVGVREKGKKTWIETLGVDNPMKSEFVQEKVKKTRKERTGYEYPLQNPTSNAKSKRTFKNNYGYENPNKNPLVKEKLRTTQWFNYYEKNAEILNFIPMDLEKRLEEGDLVTMKECGHQLPYRDYNGPKSFKCDICNPPLVNASRGEKEVLQYIKEIFEGNLEENKRIYFKDSEKPRYREFDIFSPDLKIAVEYDGIFWHSAETKEDDQLRITQREEKLALARENDFFLITIFENEWNDPNKKEIWKSILRSKFGNPERRIFARKTEVREISSDDANLFMNKNHLQGSVNASHRFGLFYREELVSVATFSKNRFKKENSIELVRFANSKNTSVVGGFSKLLKAFIEKYSPDKIVSFADRRLSEGNVYEKNDFELEDISGFNYRYYKNDRWISRYSAQKHKLKDLLGEAFDPDKTEQENMFNAGYRILRDCGNLKYVLTIS